MGTLFFFDRLVLTGRGSKRNLNACLVHRSLGKTYLGAGGELTGISAHGTVIIHCAPRALLAHIEWTVGRTMGQPVTFDWKPRKGVPGFFRAESDWQAPNELGAALASDIRGWASVLFEVTQHSSDSTEGYRWSYTPTLGMFCGQTDRFGNVLLSEQRLAVIMQNCGVNGPELQRALREALGESWDAELEPYRLDSWDEPQRLRSIG